MIKLFALDELAPGSVRRVDVDEKLPLVVMRRPDGEVRAMRDRCAHFGAYLSHGSLQPRVEGDLLGERRLTQDVVLRCPWHGYEFDTDTGRCLADPDNYAVRTYRLVVEDGWVFLDR